MSFRSGSLSGLLSGAAFPLHLPEVGASCPSNLQLGLREDTRSPLPESSRQSKTGAVDAGVVPQLCGFVELLR